MRVDVLRSMTLKSNGFGIEPEITAKIFKRGYRVYEVPITYAGRGYEQGKKITWRAGFVALWVLLKYRSRMTREDRAAPDQPDRRRSRRQRPPDRWTRCAKRRATRRRRSRSRPSWRSSATCRAICCSAQASCRRSWDAARTRWRASCGGAAAGARRPAGAEPVRRRTAALQQRGARCATARSSSASARRCCRPTTCSTRTATSSRSTDRRCSSSAAAGSASASARTSGTIAISGSGAATTTIRSRSWCARAPTRSSTCRRRRSPPASTRGAKRCWAAWRASTACRSLYVNQFGGNDDLVFDGRSCAFDADGAPIARGRSFDARRRHLRSRRRDADRAAGDVDVESEIWRALVLGTRDYARKCGFRERRARPVGRHRLGADRRDRRRGARRAITCSAC